MTSETKQASGPSLGSPSAPPQVTGAFVHMSGAPTCGCYQEDTALDRLALIVGRACVHSFNRM